MELQAQLWDIYMAMDPHELSISQLDYEMKLRDIPVYGRPRSRADRVAEMMHNESRAEYDITYLNRSPTAVDIDLYECDELIHRLDAESRKKRIDFQTLDTLWNQVVHLTARLNRIITAGDFMKRQKYEMLFWAESIRERIDAQRYPLKEFAPAVEIEVQYQRVPKTQATESTTKEGASKENEIPTMSQRELNDINELIRRLNDVSPIKLATGNQSSTPITSTNNMLISSVPASGSADIQPNATNQPRMGMNRSEFVMRESNIPETPGSWSDPENQASVSSTDIEEIAPPSNPPHAPQVATVETIRVSKYTGTISKQVGNATTAALKTIAPTNVVYTKRQNQNGTDIQSSRAQE